MAKLCLFRSCTYLYLNCKLNLLLLSFTCGIITVLFRLHIPADCSVLCPYKSILTHNELKFDSSHFVKHYLEFICPNNFRNIADWVYGWPEVVSDERVELTTIKDHAIAFCLKPGSIIFVNTDYLGKFFTEVYPYLKNKFVLITGQSDASSPNRYLSYLEDNKSKIIHWFGQNGDIHASKNNKFTHIPIGINCYEMANAIRYVHQQHANHTFSSIYGDKDEPHQYIHPLDITHKVLDGYLGSQLLLLNFQQQTDPTGCRFQVWKVFCNRTSNLTFVTCMDKPKGVDISALRTIYPRNRQYPFWLSPRGNGLDCHRTWEALYLDVIPIVWNSTLNPLYADLPIIIITNWYEITEGFLRSKLKEIARNKVNKPSVYRFEKLRFSYWRRLILSKSRHSVSNIKRENQCWRVRTISNIS